MPVDIFEGFNLTKKSDDIFQSFNFKPKDKKDDDIFGGFDLKPQPDTLAPLPEEPLDLKTASSDVATQQLITPSTEAEEGRFSADVGKIAVNLGVGFATVFDPTRGVAGIAAGLGSLSGGGEFLPAAAEAVETGGVSANLPQFQTETKAGQVTEETINSFFNFVFETAPEKIAEFTFDPEKHPNQTATLKSLIQGAMILFPALKSLKAKNTLRGELKKSLEDISKEIKGEIKVEPRVDIELEIAAPKIKEPIKQPELKATIAESVKAKETLKVKKELPKKAIKEVKPQEKIAEAEIKDIENVPTSQLFKDLSKGLIEEELGAIGGKRTANQQRASELIKRALKAGKNTRIEQVDWLKNNGFSEKDSNKIIDIGKFARSVNIEKQKVSPELKLLQLEASELKPKKVQTWDQTGEISKELLSDYKKSADILKKAGQGKALNAAEIDAARQINVNAIDRLKEMANDPKFAEAKFKEEFNKYERNVFSNVSDASSEAGRALQIHKKEISINRMANAFTNLKRKGGRGLNERELKEFKELNFENPIEVQRFIDRLGDPKLMDYIYEYWYNSILSGIPTHIVNVGGNTLMMTYQIPHKANVALIDSLISQLTGRRKQVFLSEIVPMMGGLKTGFIKGAGRAVEAIRTGNLSKFETKWNMDIGAGTLSAFERSPNANLRKIAPFISAPTRLLRAMDVWFNTMGFDSSIKALARREGLKKGLSGKKLRKFERILIDNPTDKIINESAIKARHSTFMDEPGKFTKVILKGREAIPFSRFVVPFVNTIANLTKRGVELTPGLGLILAKGKTPAEIIAKQIEGSVIGLYILSKISEGEITGALPISKNEREAFFRQGKKPWAIKSDNKWFQYRRIEPFNTPIASVVIAAEAIKKAKDDDTATEIFGDMAFGLANNLIDSSYMQGVTNLLDKRGTQRGMFQRLAASFVPYSSFWRSINRSFEVATTGETKVRDTKSLIGAFTQVIPGLSKLAKPRLNVWGKEISLQGGVLRQWIPYKFSTEIDDPVENELEKLGVYPGRPGQHITINGKKTKLSEEIYRQYAVSFGRNAYKRINGLIKKSSYKLLNEETRKKKIDRELSKIRQEELKILKRNLGDTKSKKTDSKKFKFKAPSFPK